MATVDRIEALVAEWEPKIREAFLAAFKKLRDDIVIARLEAAIRAGDIDGAIRAVGLDPVRLRPLDAALSQTFEAGGSDAMIGINAARRAGNPVLFDVRAFSADTWLRQTSGQLINDIMTDQGAMIRQALGNAVAKGMNPHDAALELVGRINKVTGHREGGLIGLTVNQAEWVRTYEADTTGVPSEKALARTLRDKRFDKTVAKAIREGKPIPAKTRTAMLNAYRNRTLRYRGEQISQAESLKTLHQAQIEAYDQAVLKGAITQDQVRRYWITKGDHRVRPEHRLIPGMNTEGVGLHSMFNTPEGPTMYPPLGFGCRCRVRMVLQAERVALAA